MDKEKEEKAEEALHSIVGYREPSAPTMNCSNCPESEITNAGAACPGLRCKLIAKVARAFGSNMATQVSPSGSCLLRKEL